MQKLKFAVLGCGFWANYQIPAWMELENIELVALYNRTVSKARIMAEKFKIPHYYDDAETLFQHEKLDFVDIITDVDTHLQFTLLAAKYGVPVICQKPMAPTLLAAETMLQTCRSAGVPLFIHENFRWQAPMRKTKQLLDSGVIGHPFKARVSFCSAFKVFENQPFLAELEQFMLTDIGSHILDVSRFLFGEVDSLYCQIASINPIIKGEDVANVFMKMQSGLHCYAEMSYASVLEKESFPQTLLMIEGEKGSIVVSENFEIRVFTRDHANTIVASPVMYDWLDPTYALVHSSIVDCNRNLLHALQGGSAAETTADDNIKTVSLVWAAYESARDNKVVHMREFQQKKIAPL